MDDKVGADAIVESKNVMKVNMMETKINIRHTSYKIFFTRKVFLTVSNPQKVTTNPMKTTLIKCKFGISICVFEDEIIIEDLEHPLLIIFSCQIKFVLYSLDYKM